MLFDENVEELRILDSKIGTYALCSSPPPNWRGEGPKCISSEKSTPLAMSARYPGCERRSMIGSRNFHNSRFSPLSRDQKQKTPGGFRYGKLEYEGIFLFLITRKWKKSTFVEVPRAQ
jgi:hypothetical protein